MGVDQELRALLDKRLRNAPPVDRNAKLADLNIDSLDLVEILFEIEDKYDVHIVQTNEQAAEATFGQLCEWVETAIAAKAGPHAETQSPGGQAPSAASR